MFCSVWKISCHDSLTDYSAPCSHISGIQRLMAQVYDAHKMTGDFEEQCKLFVASSNKPALLLLKEAAACLLYSCVQRFKFCWCRNVQCAQWSRQPHARRLLVSTQLCKTHKAYTVCTITAYHVSFLGSSQQSGERNTRLTSCNWRCSPAVHTQFLHSISSRPSFLFVSCTNV